MKVDDNLDNWKLQSAYWRDGTLQDDYHYLPRHWSREQTIGKVVLFHWHGLERPFDSELLNAGVWKIGSWVADPFDAGHWVCTRCLKNPPQAIIDACDLVVRK